MNIQFDRKRYIQQRGTRIRPIVRLDDVSESELEWKSNDDSVASVSDDGFVTMHAYGCATISVCARGKTEISASCEFAALDLPSENGELCQKYKTMVTNRIRPKKSVPPPEDVKKIIRHMEYNEKFDSIAHREYEETGKWFYVRAEALGRTDKDDASATNAVYSSLGTKDVTKMPNYSKENHEKAVEFWQSWQHPGTGVFINPRIDDPLNPDPERLAAMFKEIGPGQKNNAGVMGLLGAPPLYPPYSPSGSDEINLEELWNLLVIREYGFRSSAAGKQFSTLNFRYERGEKHLIYLLENYISTLLRRLTPESGMTKVDGFHDYPNSENTLKLFGRKGFEFL